MPKTGKSLIKKDDFIELRYLALVKNTTTKTDVKPAVPITITEFRVRGLVLRLPAAACTTGHMLLLQILPKTNLLEKRPRLLTLLMGGASAAGTQPQPGAKGAAAARPARKTTADITRQHEQIEREKHLAQREFQTHVIEITAKVSLVQQTDDGNLLVQVDFYQFDEKKWQLFVQSFQERQDTIHRVVKSVKE